jgi:putative ubiquitin-RnfH superfamily antitoxin RatB of RatAB toxin-antitoxin module
MTVALRVTVVQSPGPREAREWAVDLPMGSTVADALRACGLPPDDEVGIWGRRTESGQLLRDRDRVELYRPLLVDPKVARRERFRRQGARAAGLFSQRRPGAKQSY